MKTTHTKKPRKGHKQQLGQEPRQPVLLRIDPAIISFFREQAAAQGIGYQTLMHAVLASQVDAQALQTCRNCERLEHAIASFSNRKDSSQ